MKLFAFLLTLLIVGTRSSESDGGPLIRLKQGVLKGIKEKSTKGREINSFLRIPYIEPPIGNLRFKDPVPAGPWEGVLDATEEIDYCPQITVMDSYFATDPTPEGNEDCVYLNVYTPTLKTDAELPVMVYYHGGGFIRGGAKEYKPYALLNEDVVLVVVQYRLNVFGFLSTEDSFISGNFGLKDGVEALKWIQRNIREFGGDPDRVTVFGHSSGGMYSHFLVLCPDAKGLFHGAIMHSGLMVSDAMIDKNQHTVFKQIFQSFGCESEGEREAFLKCIQEIDSIKLFSSFYENLKGAMLMASPIVDGKYLPDKPINIHNQNQHNSVNIMVGLTREDGAFISLLMQPPLDNSAVALQTIIGLMAMFENLPQETAERIHAHYFSEGSSWEQWNKFFQEYFYKFPVSQVANSEPEDSKFKIYTYQLDHRGQYSYADFLPDLEEKKNWILHGDELFLLFARGPIYSKPLERKEDLLMRDIYTKMWTNFARTGNPTPDDSLGFRWEPFNRSSPQHLSISTKPSMEEDNYQEMLDFWSSLPVSWTQLLGSKREESPPTQRQESKQEL